MTTLYNTGIGSQLSFQIKKLWLKEYCVAIKVNIVYSYIYNIKYVCEYWEKGNASCIHTVWYVFEKECLQNMCKENWKIKVLCLLMFGW